MKNRSVFLAAAVAVAAVVSAQCSGSPSSSPVSPSSSLGATSALGDPANATAELGIIKLCKDASSNVDGEFTVVVNDNTWVSVLSPVTVTKGTCKVVALANPGDTNLVGGTVTITETSPGYQSSSYTRTDVGGTLPFTDGTTPLFLNPVHGHAVTYVNNFTEETPQAGRMTGGGSVFTAQNKRVTHGFELHCNVNDLPNNLEVNWDGNGKSQQNFHLETLDTAVCTDDPAYAPEPPDAGFDTFTGTGTGRLNNIPGATIEFVFTDHGQPGKEDTATMTIRDASNAVVLVVSGNLKNGNQQAHK